MGSDFDIEQEKWIAAADALNLVAQLTGETLAGASEVLYRRTASGLLRSFCRQMEHWSEENPEDVTTTRDHLIPREFWHIFINLDGGYKTNWLVGDFSAKHYTDGDFHFTSVIGVQFDEIEIRRLFPRTLVTLGDPPAKPETAALSASHQIKPQGGRPRKEYWEDAIVQMFDLLFHGHFIPKTQADVERAMADWISEKHDDRPSEQSIRTRAAKVWKVHKKEG